MSHGIGAQKTDAPAEGFAAGGTQREPSMEEILASIRRIIEDNDAPPASGQGGAQSVRETPLRGAPEREAPLAEAPTEEKAIAEPRPSTERASAMVERLPVEARPVPGETRGEIEHFRAELNAGNHPLRPERFEEPIPHSRRLDEESDMPSGDEREHAGRELGPIAREQEERRQSILSEYTGRKVAAAFGELNEAFEASRKRNFDQMAEEMLQPMLQDWLDNNLPTLVERLVREEIERVARGG